MSVTIIVNGLTLVHRGSAGFARATLPDVCKTPPGPVPAPYPNLARSADLAKGTRTISADGNSAAIRGSEFACSVGDEPGVAGGIVSGTFKKEATWLSFSMDVHLEGRNACRLTDKMLMNHGNTACLAGEIQAFLDAMTLVGELAALCEIYCACRATGGKQKCVEETIYGLDTATGGQSPFLAEIPYNMTLSPPRPMMSTTKPRRGSEHWWLPNHPERPTNFIPNTGMARRTDVVIVDNPGLPPSGSNLRAVVEMKFPPDAWDTPEMQIRERAYWRIASENNPSAPYLRIDEEICGCDEEGHRSPEYVPEAIPERRWQPVTSLPDVVVTAPSPSVLGGIGEAGLGLLEMIGGTVLFGVSAFGTGVLVADDVTGVGVLDDAAIPVTVGGMAVGGAGMVDGYRRWGSGISRIFGW